MFSNVLVNDLYLMRELFLTFLTQSADCMRNVHQDEYEK